MSKHNLDSLLLLMRNLSFEDKVALISKISDSILVDEQKKWDKLKTTYGKFQSSLSANEIIDEIRQSRHYEKKEIKL
jgi:hypothetical protein